MTISVQEFASRYNEKSVDFDKHFGAQCVDLFNYYNQEVVGAPWIGTPVTGGARDLYEVDNAERNKAYKRLAADSQLQIGDVLVYGPPHGRYIDVNVQKFFGHVSIVIADGRMIQQNGRKAQRTTIDPIFHNGLLGVLRPLKFIGQNSPQNVAPPSQSKNKHTIQKGDTFWGIEEENNWPHGTLQQLNPELDPKRLKIGGEIFIPGESIPSPHTDAEYYTIREGDTFWALEDAWQIPHGKLQELNPNKNPRELQIGERIRKS